jgi:hypothetical protein
MGFNGNTMGISCHIIYLVGGVSPTPLKNNGVKLSWDDEIPN